MLSDLLRHSRFQAPAARTQADERLWRTVAVFGILLRAEGD